MKKEAGNKKDFIRNKSSIDKNILTNTGHKLTIKEAKFIDLYLETGNARQSVVDSGYTTKSPREYAQTLLTKNYIADEIKYRQQQISNARIANAQEVMEYFTSVMRGEIKDQFGLDAPLSERTKAAQEMAKRTIDVENRVAGKADAQVQITLNWKRDGEETT